MGTKRFTAVTSSVYVEVCAGACVVDVHTTCKNVRLHVGASLPAFDTVDYHTLSTMDLRTFSYGGAEKVYVRAASDAVDVIVTGDNVA